MSLAAVAVAGFLVADSAVASLWRGALRQPWRDRRPYLWFAAATGVAFANMIVSQTVSLPPGETALVRSLAELAGPVGESLAVGARVAGTHPGTGAVIAQLAALVLLPLTPWTSGIWSVGTRWIGGAREVTTAAAAAAAAVAGLLVLVQAM